MIVVEGARGSGKTTKLLYSEAGCDGIVVEPTSGIARFAQDMAKRLRLNNVKVISSRDFGHEWFYNAGKKNNAYFIDQLDDVMLMMGIKGYSITTPDECKQKSFENELVDMIKKYLQCNSLLQLLNLVNEAATKETKEVAN